MDVPLRFEGEFKNEKMCKFQKSLCSLEQSLRAWFERFAKSLMGFKYQKSQGTTLCSSNDHQGKW